MYHRMFITIVYACMYVYVQVLYVYARAHAYVHAHRAATPGFGIIDDTQKAMRNPRSSDGATRKEHPCPC